jgi:Fe-S-cluster containining protein
MTKCEKTCCDMRNVSLLVNEKELSNLYGEKVKPEKFRDMGIKIAGAGGFYSVESKDFCRQFDKVSRKCLAYDARPASCREFPFLAEPDAVIIKSGCSLTGGGQEYKKLAEIAGLYGKVIVIRRSG